MADDGGVSFQGKIMRWFPIFALAVGLAGFGISYGFYQHAAAFVRESVTAEGIVIGHREGYENKRSAYYPDIRFRTPDGREHVARSTYPASSATGDHRYALGKSVTVRYRRNDPGDAEIDDYFAIWFPGESMLGISFLMCFMGLGMAMLKKTSLPRQSVNTDADAMKRALIFAAVFVAAIILSFGSAHYIMRWAIP